MSEPDSRSPESRPPMAERVELGYAEPVGNARVRTIAIGMVASVFLSVGAGCIAFGLMLGTQDRDAPPFVAIGVALIVLTIGTLVSAWFARR